MDTRNVEKSRMLRSGDNSRQGLDQVAAALAILIVTRLSGDKLVLYMLQIRLIELTTRQIPHPIFGVRSSAS